MSRTTKSRTTTLIRTFAGIGIAAGAMFTAGPAMAFDELPPGDGGGDGSECCCVRNCTLPDPPLPGTGD